MTHFLHFIISNRIELYHQTIEHIGLTIVALFIAIIIGLPLGIIITRIKSLSSTVLGSVGVIQTIPSLALLGFLLPLMGIGAAPAIVALFLYALLPIVRNTYAGIEEVDASIIEAARGMGMSDTQILTNVQLPLAVPVIFAGIRTATVINVGVATLCALIGAGGLGEFIFRGIALNNMYMIMAGALPAALLALFFDFILGLIQNHIQTLIKPLIVITALLFLLVIPAYYYQNLTSTNHFKLGLTPEFTERADGYPGLKKTYDINPPTIEMNSALLYQALKNKKVDAIVGYSTDGRIRAFHLKVLKDDKHYFPPYYCAPLIRDQTLKKYPEVGNILNRLHNVLNNMEMTRLNFLVDQKHEKPSVVARNFLKQKGFKTDVIRSGKPVIIIGGKNFTEQFILAQMFKTVIENYSNLTVGLKTGLQGTKICFDALINGEIDIYPEYTGTGLYVILKTSSGTLKKLGTNRQHIYDYVKKTCEKRFHLTWLKPIGYNNTYALIMRNKEAKHLHIKSITDLSHYLQKE
ncbi:MAG TPA: glycine betaine ABC transporter substrate-binding protein [Balneolales bacterium]|nr:glycine betaine ABC transporter substrate-binding protein [Balneolales bacterium]